MNVTLRETIAANLEAVRREIARAAERAGRDPAAVRLIAVTKTFPVETIVEAAQAGLTDFGENRVQEAAAKIPAARGRGVAAAWHLVGHLQSNKAKLALSLFDIIHSVDGLELARRLDRLAPSPVPILLEVNVGGEESKFGVAPAEVPTLVTEVRRLANLDLRGLMTVAPAVADPEEVRPVFRRLRSLAGKLALPELSMGMTSDYPVAVEEGSTMVRIGRAIFGERPAR